GSVMALKADAVEAGLWRARGEYEPAPGDLFVMDLPGPGGHVGIVLGWQATHFETIEGNSGDRVRHGVRSLDDTRIIGFVCTVPEEPFEACWSTGLGEDVSGSGTR